MKLVWQLVRGTGISSRLIGWFGSGYYSHIDVETPSGYLRGARSDVIKGIPSGYRDRPQNYETWATQTRYSLEVTTPQYERYWQFSNAQLGKPYDKRGLIDAFLLGRNWRDDGQWWCSEEVAANLEAAGLVTIPPEVRSVEPGDCAFLFAGLGCEREEIVKPHV